MRCGMPFVGERWLGGTLTNFRTIRDRLGRLEELEAIRSSDDTLSLDDQPTVLAVLVVVVRSIQCVSF